MKGVRVRVIGCFLGKITKHNQPGKFCVHVCESSHW